MHVHGCVPITLYLQNIQCTIFGSRAIVCGPLLQEVVMRNISDEALKHFILYLANWTSFSSCLLRAHTLAFRGWGGLQIFAMLSPFQAQSLFGMKLSLPPLSRVTELAPITSSTLHNRLIIALGETGLCVCLWASLHYFIKFALK